MSSAYLGNLSGAPTLAGPGLFEIVRQIFEEVVSESADPPSESNFLIFYLLASNFAAMGWSNLNMDPKFKEYRILNCHFWGAETQNVLDGEISFDDATFHLKTIG